MDSPTLQTHRERILNNAARFTCCSCEVQGGATCCGLLWAAVLLGFALCSQSRLMPSWRLWGLSQSLDLAAED
jgi:hypothetical protein